MIQLHGGEDEAFIREIRKRTGLPVIKAVPVENARSAERWQSSAADFLLLDRSVGGSGKTFDWRLIQDIEMKKPFFLAGGVTAENVTEAIKRLKPYAVDVSSGVETNGYKDRTKICEVIRRVRS